MNISTGSHLTNAANLSNEWGVAHSVKSRLHDSSLSAMSLGSKCRGNIPTKSFQLGYLFVTNVVPVHRNAQKVARSAGRNI